MIFVGQILLFEQLIKQGRLPKLKYTLDKHPYGDPFNALITQKAVEYIGGSDCVWCGGEILYPGKLLNRMAKIANDRGGSVACVLKLPARAEKFAFGNIFFRLNGKNDCINHFFAVCNYPGLSASRFSEANHKSRRDCPDPAPLVLFLFELFPRFPK